MCFNGIVYESFLIKVDFAVCIRLRKKSDSWKIYKISQLPDFKYSY
jgi:hypothetical protein